MKVDETIEKTDRFFDWDNADRCEPRMRASSCIGMRVASGDFYCGKQYYYRLRKSPKSLKVPSKSKLWGSFKLPPKPIKTERGYQARKSGMGLSGTITPHPLSTCGLAIDQHFRLSEFKIVRIRILTEYSYQKLLKRRKK